MPESNALRTFQGATAIVTGGASGIGRALAMGLARRGAEVVLADRQGDAAEAVVDEIRAAGGVATAQETDVRDYASVERVVFDTMARTGRLDYLFNNAGIGIGGEVHQYRLEDWQYILEVNLMGVIHGVQAAYGPMCEQGFGHIVNTASVAGLLASPGNTAYAATKHAVMGLSTSLRAEAAASGVRVSAICPGFVRTSILDGGGKFGRMLIECTPQGQEKIEALARKFRIIPPEELAEKALSAVARNKPIIIIPGWWRYLWWLHCLFPQRSIRNTAEGYRKFFEEE